MKLFDIFSKYTSLKSHKGLYGIEIETETDEASDYPEDFLHDYQEIETATHGMIGMYETPMKNWKAVEDGSLRDFGVEYVLREPLSFKDANKALDEFGVATKDIPFLKGTPSTSVHIHVNMMNELPITLANFITVWILFENVFVEYCGESRRSNLFAPPARIVEGAWLNYLRLFERIAEGKANALKWDQNKTKYAALNIATLGTLGSVELRCMRGTTNISEIKEWLAVINRLVEFSRTPGLTPRDVYRLYQAREEKLLFDILGSLVYNVVREGYVDAIYRNEFYLAKLASSVKDWNTFGKMYEANDEKFQIATEYLMKTHGFSKQNAQDHLLVDPSQIEQYYEASKKIKKPLAYGVKPKKLVGWGDGVVTLDDLAQYPAEQPDPDPDFEFPVQNTEENF